MDNETFITRTECRANVDKLSTSINGVTNEVSKQSKALFGDDGRGGMQHDITKIITALDNGDIKSSLSKSDKILIALITAISSIVVALIANGMI